MTTRPAAVSSPDEPLILVDEHDREVGSLAKADCHRGDGTLHRAFSVFLFNGSGELLLQQRAADKPLWPLYWSNSCCSHPRVGESVEDAARRRIREELGVDAALEFLYKFRYQARFDELGSEHELCWVLAGQAHGPVSPHPEEIAAWRYVTRDALSAEIEASPERFTPWLKMEWTEIRAHYLDRVLARHAGAD